MCRPAGLAWLYGLGIAAASSLTSFGHVHEASIAKAHPDKHMLGLAMVKRKPPKIRNVPKNQKLEDMENRGKQVVPGHDAIADMKTREFDCGVTYQTSFFSSKKSKCPAECPYFAQNRNDDLFCSFVCVKNVEECVEHNPKTTLVDDERLVCRKPMVQYCEEYKYDGTDSCVKCASTHYLNKQGQCTYKALWLLWIVGIVLGTVGIILMIWVVNFIVRPLTNPQGLIDGLAHRSREKLRQPRDEGSIGERPVFPLLTNMCTKQVAGPGMVLHFNFQAALIVWALIVGLIWVIIAQAVDPALFVLGTRGFGTPRDNCILVAWGYHTQQQLMWTKLLFLVLTYILTFAGSILFSIRQLRLFQHYDFEHKTMKDFVIMLEKLPVFKGSDANAEATIKKAVEDATGEQVVNVSIAWDFRDDEEEILSWCERDVVAIEKEDKDGLRMLNTCFPEEESSNPLTKRLIQVEELIVEDEPDPPEPDAVKEKLAELLSTDVAFVVFPTVAARDKAFAKWKDSGMQLEDKQVVFKEVEGEPDTVTWQNIGHDSGNVELWRLVQGLGLILLALLFWTVCFYLPYAASIYNFNYDNGQEPGFVYGMAFSMVVVCGNAIMYETCARVADYIGFRFLDHREACYMILYCIACLFNVLLDFVVTYFMAEKIMMKLGFRTYYGLKLSEVPTFTQRFETYAVQRTLAENTYAYAWPSTFLIPFLIEPFITIYMPLKVGIWLIRSHPRILGRQAETWVACIPFDMGRYADLLLNVILGLLIFYFPGGYTHKLFFFMAASHIFIYCFDQFKVLRSIPHCTYATMEVDWFAQAMLAPCTGMIVSCLIFKSTTGQFGVDAGISLDGTPLILCCALGWLLHTCLHLAMLCYVVPLFGRACPQDDESVTFAQIAHTTAASWFTTNPVHCLRSKYMFADEPHCTFLIPGKEHHLKENHKIGCYFDDDAASIEDFSAVGCPSSRGVLSSRDAYMKGKPMATA